MREGEKKKNVLINISFIVITFLHDSSILIEDFHDDFVMNFEKRK